MEREAEIPDAPVGQRGLGPVQQSVLQDNILPPVVIQRVQQVEIDMVRLQLGELLVEQPVEVRP